MTYGRRPAARSSATTAVRAAPRARRGRRSRSGGPSRRAARPGRCPGSAAPSAGRTATRWTSRPARAPAAAVSRAWFDQRRPVVTSASAPSASAAPTRNSRLRSLLPPNASGSRSSRLIQSSTRPPRAADSRGSGPSGDGPSSSADSAGTGPDRGSRSARDAMVAGPYHRPMATRITPADRSHDDRPARRHGALDRDLGAARRQRPALLVDRLDGTGRQDPRSTTTASARRRSTSCPGARRYTWGPTGLEHAFDADAGDFVYIPAGEIHVEENASTDRAARRRADPQLPRLARRVPGRRADGARRRPGAVLTSATGV